MPSDRQPDATHALLPANHPGESGHLFATYHADAPTGSAAEDTYFGQLIQAAWSHNGPPAPRLRRPRVKRPKPQSAAPSAIALKPAA